MIFHNSRLISRIQQNSSYKEIRMKSEEITMADPGFSPDLEPKNSLFETIFAENCMKMKEIGREWGTWVPSAPLDPPMIKSRSLA